MAAVPPRSTWSHCGSLNALDQRVPASPSTLAAAGVPALSADDAVAGRPCDSRVAAYAGCDGTATTTAATSTTSPTAATNAMNATNDAGAVWAENLLLTGCSGYQPTATSSHCGLPWEMKDDWLATSSYGNP